MDQANPNPNEPNGQECPLGPWPVVEALSAPVVKFLPDGHTVRLETPLTATVNGQQVIVAPGYVFDGASIPRWLWPLCGSPFVGKFRDAAVLHDAAYTGDLRNAQGQPIPITRWQADWLFLTAMTLRRCNRLRAWIKFAAVRLFGRKHFQG